MPMDVEGAKQLYRELTSIPGKRLGPYTLVEGKEGQRVVELQNRVDKVVSDTDPSQRVLRVPSPWHAAVLLHELVQESIQLEKKSNPRIDRFATVLRRRPRFVFRGQSDARWDLVPKIRREGVNRLHEETALENFYTLMHTVLGGFLDVSQLSAKATAQHYGIATDFLDFTLDPEVATYFAASGQKREDGQEAVVYVLPLSNAFEAGARLIFPPPLVERLYAQWGLFIESPVPDELRRACVAEVRFAPDSSFVVIRESKEVDLIGERDGWITRLADLARRHNESLNEYSVKEQIGGLPFREADRRSLTREWLIRTLGALYWVAITRYEQSEIIDTEVLDLVARDNLHVLKSLLSEYDSAGALEFDPERQDSEDMKRFASVLREAIRKIEG
jgi:hypothetical protein